MNKRGLPVDINVFRAPVKKMDLISNVNKYINLHLFFIQDGEIIQLFSVADFVQTGNWKDYLMVFQCCYK